MSATFMLIYSVKSKRKAHEDEQRRSKSREEQKENETSENSRYSFLHVLSLIMCTIGVVELALVVVLKPSYNARGSTHTVRVWTNPGFPLKHEGPEWIYSWSCETPEGCAKSVIND